jgi:hypothetical protein
MLRGVPLIVQPTFRDGFSSSVLLDSIFSLASLGQPGAVRSSLVTKATQVASGGDLIATSGAVQDRVKYWYHDHCEHRREHQSADYRYRH